MLVLKRTVGIVFLRGLLEMAEGFSLDRLLNILRTASIWFSNKPNRLRLRGSRVEVILFILTRSPVPEILLGQVPYHNGKPPFTSMWIPPQEGVRLKEDFLDAIKRCLTTEIGLSLDVVDKIGNNTQSIRFVGVVPLPKERWGERPVASNIAGTLLEKIQLKSKAYWLATIFVKDKESIFLKADGKEILDIRWVSFTEARQLILKTNRLYKANLLLRCLQDCERIMQEKVVEKIMR